MCDEYVLLHVYVTGHGYMDVKGRSQILLNQRIHFNVNSDKPSLNTKTKFMNPFPLENDLLQIFEHFKNVCIVMIADTCREENNFHEKLWDIIKHKKEALHAELGIFKD
jgi:hypothetical protein